MLNPDSPPPCVLVPQSNDPDGSKGRGNAYFAREFCVEELKWTLKYVRDCALFVAPGFILARSPLALSFVSASSPTHASYHCSLTPPPPRLL